MDASQYTDLVTSEHTDKPKYMEMVELTTQPFADQQNTIAEFASSYDLDVAVGSQLDVLGLWIGCSRVVKVPIENLYFSLNISGVGLNEGVWYETGQALFTSVTLGDEMYRRLLKAKAVANISDGTYNSVLNVLAVFFNGTANEAQVIDFQNMSFRLNVIGPTVDDETRSILDQDLLGIRPEGVRQLKTTQS